MILEVHTACVPHCASALALATAAPAAPPQGASSGAASARGRRAAARRAHHGEVPCWTAVVAEAAPAAYGAQRHAGSRRA
jgi:hypothetical protein